MNALLENGIITEMPCGSNFAYLLQDSQLFLTTEYKVLQSQGAGCFVRCMKLLYNGKLQFYYLTQGYKSLERMIPDLDAESFRMIVVQLFANVLAVKNNGFLSCRNVDISFERIYVDPATYKTALVYLPVSKRFFGDEEAFENELRTSLVKAISGASALASPKMAQFRSDLSNGMLSLKDLYDRIRWGKGKDADGGTGKIRLVGMHTPTDVEISVTKNPFVIGKNPSAVDGVVSFNKMISRVHCRVTKENGEYQVEDLRSANGTYVNRVRLTPGQPHRIRHGDVVRLANSDFRVVMDA